MISPDNISISASSLLAVLTPAEQLVAVHLAFGLCNKEICTLLGKAEPTIKHQVSSIMVKTGVPSRCRFIALYYQNYFASFPSATTGEHGLMPRVLVKSENMTQAIHEAQGSRQV